MTEPREETAELAAVKSQFVQAEKRLRELAQGAVELTRASVLLKKARMGLADGADGLRDLSGRLSEYIDSLAGLTAQLQRATETMEKAGGHESEPTIARLEERLDAIQDTLTRGSLAGGDAEAIPGLENLALLPNLASQMDSATQAIASAGLGSLHKRLDAVTELLGSAATGEDKSSPRLAQTLERLDGSISELLQVSSMLQSTSAGVSNETLLALDKRLADMQSSLTKGTGRAPSGPDGSPQTQLGLLPEVEDSLMALASEMHAKELSMIDMFAELRRSLGREADRRENSLGAQISRESASIRHSLDRVRRALWILGLALFSGLALVALLS
jgi:uncharacterized phage infection (PIP) family protein YhgE